MSDVVFPTLPGIGFSVKRTPMFKTRVTQSISGMETRISDWTVPKYTYELTYELLREHGGYQELKTLQSFWSNRRGSFDTFQFDDPDDNTVTGQPIGIGDGVTTTFQLYRSFGDLTNPAWIDPIYAPNEVTNVYLNGVVTAATVTRWGTATPGVLTFASAPALDAVITADFTYYWPCRFVDDTVDFEKFMALLWETKSIKFITIKLAK